MRPQVESRGIASVHGRGMPWCAFGVQDDSRRATDGHAYRSRHSLGCSRMPRWGMVPTKATIPNHLVGNAHPTTAPLEHTTGRWRSRR